MVPVLNFQDRVEIACGLLRNLALRQATKLDVNNGKSAYPSRR